MTRLSAKRLVILSGLAALACLFGAAPALGAARWQLSSRAAPTNLAPGSEGLINVAADDLGTVGVSGAGTPITITDVLPVGLKVTDAKEVDPRLARSQSVEEKAEDWKCSVEEERIVTCSTSLSAPPYERLEVEIPVKVDEPSGTEISLPNEVSVHGGSAVGVGVSVPAATLTRNVRISDAPVTFGLEEDGYAIAAENEDGSPDTQAGSHPFQLTSTLLLNQVLEEVQAPGQPRRLAPSAPALTKDLTFNLPPGLLGNLTAADQCSDADFSSLAGTAGGVRNLCPASSSIGVAVVTILAPSPVGYKTLAVPLFNLEPAPGEPARFGFEAEAVPVVVDTAVDTGGDYGVTATVSNATAAAQVLGTEVIFWGSPSSESHDNSRGWSCLREGRLKFDGESCTPPNPRAHVPFLRLPTACQGGLTTSLSGLAWTGEQLTGSGAFPGGLTEPLATLTGCGALPFTPSLTVTPEQPGAGGTAGEPVTSGSTPTGVSVDVRVNQTGTLTEGALGDADVRNATVTLPEGMVLSPSAANGLEACSEAQVGYLGEGGPDPLASGTPEPLRFTTERAQCPEASKVGVVRVKTPLLGEELTGSVYLAAQDANPFGSLVALYIVAENEKLGVRVKLAGEGRLNESTGQVSTTFTSTPQVPFDELKVTLFGGARGPLSTPALCGSYSANTSFEAWSSKTAAPTSAPFPINSGPGGAACANPLPFAPAFSAGVTDLQAGSFTGFTLTISHPDADQPLQGLTVHLPEGIAAILASLTPCQAPPAGQEWSCGADSLVGQSTAWAGLGEDPVTLPGTVYLTAGYGGAPFGLLVVTPAKAGPFDLGNVDVRSKILIDPSTAAVTVVSDPFPTFVKGVPAQIKQLSVSIDRPGFEFNPTSCSPTQITGSVTGDAGGAEPVSSPFQVSGCQNLPFAPKLTASATGHGSRTNGTGFTVHVSSSGLGQSNIAKVRLQLPVELPSRLTTIQKACPEATFNANPANCNPESVIGSATIHTPVLKNPLSGPAYLVSHGGAAFPDVEFVLQGEGIVLVLDGQTDIKKGVTYSRFEAAPDAPFTTFETVLPAGPHSALGAYAKGSEPLDLCSSTLTMPTEIVSQSGAALKSTTVISKTGCSGVQSYKVTRAQKLQKALTACRKSHKHSRSKRVACERKARRAYGPASHAKSKASRTSKQHKRGR